MYNRVVADKTLTQRLKSALDTEKEEIRKKDNLTDVATQIDNQPKPQTSTPQSQSNNNQPQNLEPNQVIAVDGTIIDLTQDEKDAIKKIIFHQN